MNQKWNLQDIRPAQPRKSRTPTEPLEQTPTPKMADPEESQEEMSVKITNGSKKKNRSLFIAIAVFILIVMGGVVASILMGGAELTVYPKYREPNVNAVFTASQTVTNDEIPYEIMTLDAEGERQVTASGQEQVTQQAEGTIFIYNNYSADPIRLVTNTRFESPEGLIYKIKDPAVVPGYTSDGAGGKKPGVITAEVYADEVGEQYNIGPSRFTVPGFKGEPEYEGIYAESTIDFSGGFDGLKFIIDDKELQTAQQALRLELRDSLLQRVENEKPAGFVVFDGALTFTYESLPAVEYGENLVTIKEKVYLRIPLFKEEVFASHIAQATIPGYEGAPVRIEDYDVLTFKYEGATTSASDISIAESLAFNLQGRPMIVWEYDEGKLKADLLNKNRTALNQVLGGYPAIETARAVIRPFWKSKFPTKLDEITVIEILGQKAQ